MFEGHLESLAAHYENSTNQALNTWLAQSLKVVTFDIYSFFNLLIQLDWKHFYSYF